MAMLAEPRKKQKWSLNPRGSAWMNDSSKFGEKLLRKMGWSDGQGLGANQQGIKEHIKVKVKHDSKGLGFKQNDQVWVEVENDFASLLSKLSSQSEPTADTTPSESSVPVESVSRSLEEKSKKSKARVHYQKFTRGKDLSRYSKRDLECIFGVSSKPVDSKHEENQNFVPSGNMEEYFNKKKKNKGSEVENTETSNLQTDTTIPEEPNSHEPVADEIVSKKKKSKKAKKRKHDKTEPSELDVKEENEKIKRKKDVESEPVQVNLNSLNKDVVEATESEVSEPKKKKKNKKKKKSKEEKPSEQCVEIMNQVDGLYDSSEVEEFLTDPSIHLESNCTDDMLLEKKLGNYQITKSTNTCTKQDQKLYSEVLTSSSLSKPNSKKLNGLNILDKNRVAIENLNANNEKVTKQVDEIVQIKINNYLSQVFNRKDKIVNPAHELKEKKKKMVQEDDSCVQFSGSNLASISGYGCY